MTPCLVPSVSVIIPTYNRAESLRLTLQSLDQQIYPATCFDVLVVDDGGTDGTQAVAHEKHPYGVTYYYQQNQGDHVARNVGASKSAADILVFLDDDIIANAEYLASLTAEYQPGAQIIVLPVIHDSVVHSDTAFARLYEEVVPRRDKDGGDGLISYVECMSGILSVRRTDFYAIGGMQLLPGDRRNKWGGVDFAYRAHCLGFRFRLCRGAVAEHKDCCIADLATYCHNRETVSRAAPLLFQKYPALAEEIPMFRDKGPIAWTSDSPGLVARKMLRAGLSSRQSVAAMMSLAQLLEARAPQSHWLARLYRWIVSAHIYRGYRAGLSELAEAAR